MKYEVKQINTDYCTDEKEVAQVLKSTCLNFINNESEIETVLEKEMYNYKTSQNPLQHFYLVNRESGEIIASLGTVIRNSTIPNKKNIVVTVVNTNKYYRKQGLMEMLIKFVIALYEDEDFHSVKNYFVYDDLFMTKSKEFISKYVNNGSFWTLYSAVGDYYARFGFVPVKTLNYYIIPSNGFLNGKYESEFDIKGNEEFLTIENSDEYLVDDKYIPDISMLSKDPIRCCSFKNGSIMRFLHGNRIYFNSKGINIQHYGLILKSKQGTTVFCITHFFDPSILAVRRFFTNVSDDDILKYHLERIYEYINWYINNYSLRNEKGKIIFSEGDIIAPEKAKIEILNYFKEKQWIWNNSNSRWNPMLREWKSKRPVGDWEFNGFWCFS